jgi:hypothetical protein
MIADAASLLALAHQGTYGSVAQARSGPARTPAAPLPSSEL